MLRDAIYQNSNIRQIIVMFLWATPCLMFATNFGIADFIDLMRKNVNSLVVWTWYAIMAASCCITCMLTRVLLMIIQGTDGGQLMAILFNAGLAGAISLLLEPVDNIDLETLNTPVEEVILSIAAGYFFYEMFYLRTRKSFEPCMKILGIISATAFIITTLCNGSGAKVVLTFLFLYSSAIPVLKLPYFGSSKFTKSKAYKAAVCIAHAFAVHQRIFHAPGLFLKFWSSPTFRYERFEWAATIFIHSLAIGVCLRLCEVIHKCQKEKDRSELGDENLGEVTDDSLVTYKMGKRTYEYE